MPLINIGTPSNTPTGDTLYDAFSKINTNALQVTSDIASKVNTSDVINTLVSTETAKPLSANQGKVLNDKFNLYATDAEVAIIESDLYTAISSVPSGSPKGTYANLAALQAAFPTGNTNIYVTLNDGHWYYYNSGWQDGGLYQSPLTATIKSNQSLSLAQRKDDVIYGILDQYTGEDITLSKVTGTPTVDGIIYFQLGSEYFKRNTKDIICVDIFNALGKGTVDEKVSIQKAIDFCIADKKTLFFKKGTYLLANASLVINGAIKIIGENKDDVIIKTVKSNLSNPNGEDVSGSPVNYKDCFVLDNNEVGCEITFSDITLDGGNSSLTKIFNYSHKGVNGWSSTAETIKKVNFYNVSIKNFEGEGASANNYNALGEKLVELAEYTNCNFEYNAGAAVNINGCQKVFNSTFNNTQIEHANHRADGFLDVQNSTFINCFGYGKTGISCLNEKPVISNNTESLDARANTYLTVKNCKFYNDKASALLLLTAPYSFGGVIFYGVDNVSITNNNFKDCGAGAAYGFSPIVIREANNNIIIENNSFERTDSFFNSGISFPEDNSLINSVSVLNNIGLNLWQTDLLANIYTVSDKYKIPFTLVSKNNNVYFKTKNNFTATNGISDFIILKTNTTYKYRAIVNIVTSVFSYFNITNASQNTLVSIFPGSSLAVGVYNYEGFFKTDNISSSQYFSNFLIQQMSSVDNSYSILIEEIDADKLTRYTVATLPTGKLGDTAYVTDATAPTYLGALTGGGAINCSVFHNGTIWVSN
jgi:hypothetical protein